MLVRSASAAVPATGRRVMPPMRTSWRKVLYFEISVGCTSALGREKFQ